MYELAKMLFLTLGYLKEILELEVEMFLDLLVVQTEM
jgi:hypothetical protein